MRVGYFGSILALLGAIGLSACEPVPPAELVLDLTDAGESETWTLGAGESLRYSLASPSGCRLDLAWRRGPAGSLLVRIEQDSKPTDREFDLAGEANTVSLDLAELPLAPLTIELTAVAESVVLERAELVHQSTPTDVIWIVVDTLRADYVFGGPNAQSLPGLEAFAEDAIVFEQAFAHAPMTLPSHTAMFTALHPFENGVTNNGQWRGLRKGSSVIGPWLAQAGYHTSAVISMGTLGERTNDGMLFPDFDFYDRDFRYMVPAEELDRMLAPLFDELSAEARPSFAFIHYSDPHEPYNSHGARRSVVDVSLDGTSLGELNGSDFDLRSFEFELSRGQHGLRFSSEEEFVIRAFDLELGGEEIEIEWLLGDERKEVKEAICRFENTRLISRAAKLDVWANDLMSNDERIERYSAELAYTDRSLARLFARLKELGRYDDALILFTSDHGEALGERGVVGHVQTLFDDVLHVPLAIKLPKNHPAQARLAARRTGLVRHIDLVPTILDLLGLAALPGASGKSLLDGNPALHLAETHRPEAKRDVIALRDERFKMLYFPEIDRFELFDVVQDPSELTDVYAEQQAKRPSWPAILRRTGAVGEPGKPTLSPATRDELEALGYF